MANTNKTRATTHSQDMIYHALVTRSAKDDMTIWPQCAAIERDGALDLKLHAPSMSFILQLGIEVERLL